jgi:hypothetical protein
LYIHFILGHSINNVHCITLHCPFAQVQAQLMDWVRLIRRISQSSKWVPFSLGQGPRVDLSSSYGPRIILKWFGQRLDAQKSPVIVQSTRNPRKSTVVNCARFYGLEGGKWFERPHSCPYESHLTYQRPRLKIWRSDRKFPKIAGDL